MENEKHSTLYGDEDSFDLDNRDGIIETIAKMRKESKGIHPLLISVTSSIVNVTNGHAYCLVIFPKPGKTFDCKL